MFRLIYLLCVFYICYRLLRWLFGLFGRWVVRKQTEHIYTNVFGRRPPRNGYPFGGGRSQEPAKPTKKKIFDKSDGEYVDFVEIKQTESSDTKSGSAEVKYKKEEQITDAEWHDIS
ncbi:MAG: DUF4834 family protein [Muribaculum sp.]|nr:DUF4834 family protein [Muribaculaceae bacterium]MCM1080279.1 DUF4834 family protein [Muribaculum sp.]